jgi:sugar phosphate isomerase/epimerase
MTGGAAGLKGRFPFRLGTTSYIVPADILPNAEHLAPLVDDVELVIFESPEQSNLPDSATVQRLAELGRERDLSYTLHLPLDLRLGDADETVRGQSVAKLLAVAERFWPLQPRALVVHFDWDGRGGLPADLAGWRARLALSVRELLLAGLRPRDLCVETLAYPFEVVEPVVLKHDLSICMDVGHLLLKGWPPEQFDAFLDRHLERCRIVHLHGIVDGRDHADLGGMDRGLLTHLIVQFACAGAADRIVTLEVFSQADLEKSLAVLDWRGAQDG